MDKNLLAEAIGFMLADLRGLNLVEVEATLSGDHRASRCFAADMVRAINDKSQTTKPLPKAILLVSEAEFEEACSHLPDVVVERPTGELKFRLDDRVVVQICALEAESARNSFSLALSETFPYKDDEAELNHDDLLKPLAPIALERVLAESGVSVEEVKALRESDPWIEESLSEILWLLRNGYEKLQRAVRVKHPESPPQVLWINHVGSALSVLADLISRNRESVSDSGHLAELLERFLWAGFSLPRPDNKRSYRTKNFENFYEACRDNWSSTLLIRDSFTRIAECHLDDEADHPLAMLDWEKFDEVVVRTDWQTVGPLYAFTKIDADRQDRLELFAQLSEKNYFGPWLKSDSKPEPDTAVELKLSLRHKEGHLLTQADSLAGVCFIESSVDQPLAELRSTDFQIVVSGFPEELGTRLIEFGLRPILVDSRGKYILKSEEFRLDEDSGDLVADAQIVRPIQGHFAHQHSVLEVTLSINEPEELSNVRVSVAPKVVVLAPDGAAAYLLEKSERGQRLRSVEFIGSVEFDQAGLYIGSGVYSIDLLSKKSYEIVMWGRDTTTRPMFAGSALDAIDGRPNLWVRHNYQPEKEEHVLINGVDIAFLPDGDIDPLHSPIVAAIEKRMFSRTPTEAQSESFIGGLESLYSHLLTRSLGERYTGHIVVPSDLDGVRIDAELFSCLPDQTFVLPDISELEAGKNRRRDFESVPPELIDSSELKQFRSSFDQLKLREIITEQVSQGYPGWLSRIELKHLHESENLRNYLQAYSGLVRRAREIGNTFGILWASYPFAVSIWSMRKVSRLESVLLSPLHPIRLAWLAASEDVLSQVPQARARRLALGVEGWNIPIFGPTEKAHQECLAVPMDPGPHFEFLGWSQLVRDHPSRMPSSIGGRRVPSSSSGAISEASVRSALTVFNRIHPYLSSICVDLADTAPVSRASGVDRQILEAARKQDLALEVHDSIMRDGEIPRFANEVPQNRRVIWKRYDPSDDAQTPDKVHIRILQNPDITISVEPQPGNRELRRGVVGKVPLRRFVVPNDPTNVEANARSVSGPTPYPTPMSGEFSEALSALEIGAATDPVQAVSIQLPNQGGLVGESFLTVFGESHISPAAIAALFRENRENPMMVWEWSTPFRSDVREFGKAVVDSRSHYSIARIPIRFKEEIRKLLRSLKSDEPTMADVDKLLGVLGTRGVSLANLLASGETQALSALGFYIAYQLIDVLWNEETPTFLLPLDVCQGFIAALTNDTNPKESSKRSDLLAMTISNDRLHLRVLELKYLRAGSPLASLPEVGANDQNLIKGRKQLRVVQSLLENVIMNWRASQQMVQDLSLGITDAAAASAELKLSGNALAVLLEAGMKTSPSGSGRLNVAAKALRGLADGTLELRLEDPLLLALYSLNTPDPIPRYGSPKSSSESQRVFEFLADPRMLMSQVEVLAGPIVEQWREAMSTGNTESVVTGIKETSPVEPSPVEPPPLKATDELTSDGRSSPEEVATDEVVVSPNAKEPTESSVEEDTELPAKTFDNESDSESASDEAMEKSENETVAESGVTSDRTENSELVVDGDGIRVKVGRRLAATSGPSLEFWPSNTRLNQFNVGVVGDLGTGKTQLLQSLVYQMRKEASEHQTPPMSGLILDYKRDYQTPQFLEAVNGRALDPVGIPLDVFRVERVDGVRALRHCQAKARQFADTIGKIYSIGAVQSQNLTKVVRELIQNSENSPTMREVYEAYSAEVGGAQDSVTSVLESFVFGEVFADDPNVTKTMAELLEDQVITLNLAGVGVDQNLKNALVALFLNEYYAHMLKLTKWKPIARGENQLRVVTSFLLVDEATNIMSYEFEVLTQILQQGREFGVGVLLSSQYLSHFETSRINYKEPLRTWFIHKVPQIKQKELQSLGVPHATEADATRVSTLEKHELYYVSLDVNGVFIRGTPFFELIE